LGIALLGFGLLLYVLGRSQTIHQLEVGSQIPVFAGIVCLMLGADGVRKLWFPILLLAFLVPIPGSILDQLLLPLKEWVSGVVDTTLHTLGYPIARNGVVLIIGSYSLLIADACSGLNSMVALSGIGLLYTYVAGHSNRWLNAALLLSILPIAFIANIIRVMILVLVTYYAGDAAGQAFHDRAGILEIALAFGGFFVFDHLIQRVSMRSPPPKRPSPAMGQLS
jgi:exosortase